MENINFLPNNEHIFVHAKIKNLSKNFSDYKKTSLNLIDMISKTKPKSVIIPTFTYSFTKKNFFSINDSPSEVGRFSEEIRKISSSSNRLVDPIFSSIDFLEFGFNDKKVVQESFSDNSIFAKLDKLNGVILNFDLEYLTSTQIHFYEKKCNVTYRSSKIFKGEIIDERRKKININYSFFCRDLDQNLSWDRGRIKNDMSENKILNNGTWENCKYEWFFSRDLGNFLKKKLEHNERYLLKK